MLGQSTVSITPRADDPATLKLYFTKIRELHKSGNDFPVTLDDVWPLVYKNRKHAVEELTKSKDGDALRYLQGVDYQASPETRKAGPGTTTYMVYTLSVSCMEYFVARKVRAVFEVYRQVFHRAMDEAESQLPKSFSEALYLAARQQELIEAQQKALAEATPKAEHYDQVMEAAGNFSVGEAAKLLGTGQNRLFQWMRDSGLCFVRDGHNVPYQEYVDMGVFAVKHKTFPLPSGERTYPQIYITPRGLDFIRRKMGQSTGIAAAVQAKA